MQSFKHADTTIHHNGDFTGDVYIRRGDVEICVPVAALVEFVAQYVRSERIATLESSPVVEDLDEQIAALESAPPSELLGLHDRKVVKARNR